MVTMHIFSKVNVDNAATCQLAGGAGLQPQVNLSQARELTFPRVSGGGKAWSNFLTSAMCHAYMAPTPSQSNSLPAWMQCRCVSRRHVSMEEYFVSPLNLIMPVIAARVRPPEVGLFGVSMTHSHSPLNEWSGYLRASTVLAPL